MADDGAGGSLALRVLQLAELDLLRRASGRRRRGRHGGRCWRATAATTAAGSEKCRGDEGAANSFVDILPALKGQDSHYRTAMPDRGC
jgi:hypothetical protein